SSPSPVWSVGSFLFGNPGGTINVNVPGDFSFAGSPQMPTSYSYDNSTPVPSLSVANSTLSITAGGTLTSSLSILLPGGNLSLTGNSLNLYDNNLGSIWLQTANPSGA